MLSDGSVDTAFLGQITQQRMGIAASQLSPVTNRYGMYVRKNNNQWKTIEDLIEDKNAIIPIRTDWPLPDIHALFKDHKQLNDWPLTSNQELLSRGLVDAIMDAGVLRDGIITYAEVNFDQTYLDGNTTDYLRFTPAFTVGNEDLVKPFDIATAFLVYNGTMDTIIDRHVTGVQMPYRERVIK